MKKCSNDINGQVNVASAFESSAKSRGGREKPGPISRSTSGQVPRERPNSTVSTLSVTSRSHQRRWSVDYCKRQTPPAIIVRKNKKEPEPPQRTASLLRLQTSSHLSFKRYSCPPIGIFTSTSSSSSPTSSCFSPTSVPTAVIIGPDPLGWKIQPNSRSNSSQTHAKRLSLQIPLPAVPTPSSPSPELSSQTKPALRPKPFRRHHSESSAFLRSLGKTLPVVTLEQLHAVNLRHVNLSDESDDVFDEPERVTASPLKIPPPVLEKTATARKTAQLIARSRHPHRAVAANVIPAMTSERTICHNICTTKMAELHLDNICNRDR